MKLRTQILVFSVVCLLAFAVTPVAMADCNAITLTTLSPLDPNGTLSFPITPNNVGTVPNLNQEGLAERVADILIYDDGTGDPCFTDVHKLIVIAYNAPFTVPTAVNSAAPPNIDVMDSKGNAGLSIASVVTSNPTVSGGGSTNTVTITVQTTGTAGDPTTGANGSALRIKNIRINASTLSLMQFATATISTTEGRFADHHLILNIGKALPTIQGGDGGPKITPGEGEQSEADTLDQQASLTFTEGFENAFRPNCNPTPCSGVFDDITTSPTSLIFSASGIPNAVTITFPSDLIRNGLHFAARPTGACPGLSNGGAAGNLCVVYDTVSDALGIDSMTIDTAALSFVGAPKVDPKIGVQVADPSGWGDILLQAAFGPAPGPAPGCPQFFGDDCTAATPAGKVPQYVDNVGPSAGSGGTRDILDQQEWIEIDPIRTAILYTFATSMASFNTGVAVSNTGLDCLKGDTSVTGCVFIKEVQPGPDQGDPTRHHAGLLHLFFFPTGGTPFRVDSPCLATVAGVRGLDGAGNVQPGGDFAAALTTILSSPCAPSGFLSSFDGYIIVVAEFKFAHGYGITFGPSGQMTTFDALILGNEHRNGRRDRKKAEHLDQ
jgi:hypothetical protein